MTLQPIEYTPAHKVSSILGREEEKAPIGETLDALGMDSVAPVESLVAIEQQFRSRLVRE